MRIKQPQHFRRFINHIIYDPWHTGHSQSNILLSRKSASSSDGHVPFLMQIAAHNQPSALKSHKFARRQLGWIEDIVMQSNYLNCSFDKIYKFNRQFYPHTLLSLHSGYEKVLQGRKKGLEYPSREKKTLLTNSVMSIKQLVYWIIRSTSYIALKGLYLLQCTQLPNQHQKEFFKDVSKPMSNCQILRTSSLSKIQMLRIPFESLLHQRRQE